MQIWSGECLPPLMRSVSWKQKTPPSAASLPFFGQGKSNGRTLNQRATAIHIRSGY